MSETTHSQTEHPCPALSQPCGCRDESPSTLNASSPAFCLEFSIPSLIYAIFHYSPSSKLEQLCANLLSSVGWGCRSGAGLQCLP